MGNFQIYLMGRTNELSEILDSMRLSSHDQYPEEPDNVKFDCKHSPPLTKPSVIASGAKQSPAFNCKQRWRLRSLFRTKGGISFLAMTRKCDIVQVVRNCVLSVPKGEVEAVSKPVLSLSKGVRVVDIARVMRIAENLHKESVSS